jgi:hypothetical protein
VWTDVVIGQTPLFAHDTKVISPPSPAPHHLTSFAGHAARAAAREARPR